MADPNIQTLIYPLSIGPGLIKTYQTDVNKQTGSSITYDISNLGQKDAVWRSEREVAPDGKVFYRANPVRSSYYENLSDAEKKFIQTNLAYQSDNQRAEFIKNSYTQDQINNLFPNMPRVRNTAPPSQFVTTGGTTTNASGNPLSQDEIDAANAKSFSGDITDIEGVSSRSSYGPYKYPETLDLRTQDVIKFTMIKPVATKFNSEFGAKTLSSKYNADNILGHVILPIQPSINDSNNVDWSGLNLNAFEAYAAGQAITLAKQNSLPALFAKAGASIQDIADKFLQSTELQQAAQIGLAQQAVGIQGLLSRATGAIINPNLELLFNGPQLRSFSFTFRMSPRSEDDAYQVKSIIRFFKQGMSVKTTSSSVFLKSPHVFKIQYQTPGREDHPSINRIKICALVGCDVDYTPDGTYMTFNDSEGKHPMTSYGMSLRFSEIEPVYDQDYSKLPEDEIGY